jgi:hypothetical protein
MPNVGQPSTASRLQSHRASPGRHGRSRGDVGGLAPTSWPDCRRLSRLSGTGSRTFGGPGVVACSRRTVAESAPHSPSRATAISSARICVEMRRVQNRLSVAEPQEQPTRVPAVHVPTSEQGLNPGLRQLLRDLTLRLKHEATQPNRCSRCPQLANGPSSQASSISGGISCSRSGDADRTGYCS